MSKVQTSSSAKQPISLILCVAFLAAVVLAIVGFVGKNAALTEKAALNTQLEETLAELETSKADGEAKAAELEALQASMKEAEEKAARNAQTVTAQTRESCEALRGKAEGRLAEAAQSIVRRVVNL